MPEYIDEIDKFLDTRFTLHSAVKSEFMSIARSALTQCPDLEVD